MLFPEYLYYPSLGEYMIKNSLKEANNLKWIKVAERVKEIYYHVARYKAG